MTSAVGECGSPGANKGQLTSSGSHRGEVQREDSSLGGGRVERDDGVCGSERKAVSLQISESDSVGTYPSRHREEPGSHLS